MLRACIFDFGGSWDRHMSLAEFAYNNSLHSSIGMTPYEALYGKTLLFSFMLGQSGEETSVRT